jgi:hypothetical protein
MWIGGYLAAVATMNRDESQPFGTPTDDAMGLSIVLDGEEYSLPATPWELGDIFDIDMLPQRPDDPVMSDEVEDNVHVPEVTGDDYDGVERFIYQRLRDTVRSACNVNTIWKKRKKAIEWIFVQSETDADGGTFHEYCRALGARPIVVQARLQYQLYKAGVPLPESLPFMADALPKTVAMEVLFHTSELGVRLARAVWNWPGIRADLLRQSLDDISDRDFKIITERLEETGHLALKHGFWFLTCRNPELIAARNRHQYHWSKSFLGDD